MQALKNTFLIGWPDTKDQVPLTVRDYWNFREELTLNNGVLFKNQRIIIPHCLRSEMIARLHSSHLGTEACLRKARDRIFWPDMTTQIKEAVAKCEVWAEYQTANPQQPMQTHKIPERPWTRVGADLFSLHSKDYIVLVDYYSDFVEVDLLKNTNSVFGVRHTVGVSACNILPVPSKVQCKRRVSRKSREELVQESPAR